MMKMISKNAWRERKEQVLIDAPFAKYKFWCCVVNDEVTSTSSLLYEQTEVME